MTVALSVSTPGTEYGAVISSAIAWPLGAAAHGEHRKVVETCEAPKKGTPTCREQRKHKEQKLSADVQVINEGSILFFAPQSEEAKGWFEDHIGADNGYQPYWPARVVVEANYANDIIQELYDAGLEVEILQ